MKSIASAALLVLSVQPSTAGFAAEAGQTACREVSFVLYVDGWTNPYDQLDQSRALQGALSGLLEEADSTSPESFAMNALEIEETTSSWFGLSSTRVPVGAILSSGPSAALCAKAPSAAQAGARIQLELSSLAARDARFRRVELFALDHAAIYQEKACDPSWFSYEFRAGGRSLPRIGDWVSCNRPGTLLGSYQSLSDGSAVKWAVFNPFEVSGWCRTPEDMEAESSRLRRECPGVLEVRLVRARVGAHKARALIGDEAFLAVHRRGR